MSKKFYEQTWFIVLILIFFFPVGLVLVWTNKHWSQKGKIIATVIVAVLVIVGLGSNSGKNSNDTEVTAAVSSETSITEKVEETTTATEKQLLIDYKIVEQKDVGAKYTYRIVVDPSATEQELLDVFHHIDTTSYDYAIAWFYSSESVAYDMYDVAVIERTEDGAINYTAAASPSEVFDVITTSAEVSEEELRDSVQALLEFAISSSFTNYSVGYNEDIDAFCINVTADGIARDAQAVVNGQLDRSEWDKLVDSMVSCSSGAQELVNTAGLDSAVMLSVLNDENMDNTLLTIVNDTVIYNAVE